MWFTRYQLTPPFCVKYFLTLLAFGSWVKEQSHVCLESAGKNSKKESWALIYLVIYFGGVEQFSIAPTFKRSSSRFHQITLKMILCLYIPFHSDIYCIKGCLKALVDKTHNILEPCSSELGTFVITLTEIVKIINA